MRGWISLVPWTLGLMLTLAPAAAKQGKGKGKGQGRGRGAESSHSSPARSSRSGVDADIHIAVFRPRDQTVIRDYVRDNKSGLPPGLAKRGGNLPPGLEKQLRKNGRLPAGLEKKLHPFPAALERRLPPLGPGLERGFISGRAVIYKGKSRVVLDVFNPF